LPQKVATETWRTLMRDMEEALLKYKRFSDGYDGNQR
jgi:hypothetical protein